MTFSTMYEPGGLRAWVSLHWHQPIDFHLQLRVRSANGGFLTGGYFDLSLLLFTISVGYWRLR